MVNHHLLFTDLAVRRATQNYTQAAVLPAYQRVVLDEAHNVEDAATSHLGVEVTRRGLFRAMSRLDRRGRGILTAVQEEIGSGRDGPRRSCDERSDRSGIGDVANLAEVGKKSCRTPIPPSRIET